MFMMVVGRLSMRMQTVIMLFLKMILALSRIAPDQIDECGASVVKLFTNRTWKALLFDESLAIFSALPLIDGTMLRL